MLIVVNADSRLGGSIASDEIGTHTHAHGSPESGGSMNRGDCSTSTSTVKWEQVPIFRHQFNL